MRSSVTTNDGWQRMIATFMWIFFFFSFALLCTVFLFSTVNSAINKACNQNVFHCQCHSLIASQPVSIAQFWLHFILEMMINFVETCNWEIFTRFHQFIALCEHSMLWTRRVSFSFNFFLCVLGWRKNVHKFKYHFCVVRGPAQTINIINKQLEKQKIIITKRFVDRKKKKKFKIWWNVVLVPFCFCFWSFFFSFHNTQGKDKKKKKIIYTTQHTLNANKYRFVYHATLTRSNGWSIND